MKKNFFVGFVTLLFLGLGTAKAVNFSGSKLTGAYVQPDGGGSYFAWGQLGIDIGKKHDGGPQITETDRTKYTFDLTTIPSNATITGVSISYAIYNAGNGSYAFHVTAISNYTDPQGIWYGAASSSTVFTASYGSGNVSNSTLTSMVNSSRGSKMYLGAYSDYESYLDSYANLNLTLTVTYTVPLVADNNFTAGDGTHGSISVGGSTRSAPYSFSWTVGNNLTLQAVSPQTDNQGYQRIWNTTSCDPSDWQKNGSHLSYSQTYTFTVSSGDNNATYLANLHQNKVTTSGTMASNEIWISGVTLTGNVTVPSGVTLAITSCATVNLNGYSLASSGGGTIAIQGGTINGIAAEIVNAGNTVGYYPSIQSALSAATSGQTVSVVPGTFTISSNLTVALGVTFQLNAGVTFKFNSGRGLTSNGRLLVSGSESQPVTFTANGTPSPSSPPFWGTITLNGSGANNSTLNYMTVMWGTEIDVLNCQSVTISNSWIQYMSVGIYCNNAHYCAIQGNKIKDVMGHGVNLINFGGNIYQNTIWKTSDYIGYYNSGYHTGGGIICQSGSSPVLDQDDVRGYDWGIAAIWNSDPVGYRYANSPTTMNNRVTNCNYGLIVYYNSFLNFGSGVGDMYSQNSIHDNFYYAADIGFMYPDVPSQLSATDNWWGSYPPDYSIFYVSPACTLSVSSFHSTDPWGSVPLPSVQTKGGVNGDLVASIGPTGTPNQASAVQGAGDSLSAGIQLRIEGKFEEAKDFFVSYLSRNPKDQRAYVELYACADSETAPSIIQYFKSLPAQAAKGDNLLLSNLYLMQGNANSAKQVNNSIIDANPNTPLAVKAKLNNFYIALYNDNNPNKASALLKEVEQSAALSTPIEVSDAEHALQTYVDPKTGNMPNAGNQQLSVSSQPMQDGLSANYPNPFNPTTLINYQLSASGHVTLKVYDILGREVATLVDENQDSGIHSATFDGSRFASGIYFYRLSAPGVNQVKKMVLTK